MSWFSETEDDMCQVHEAQASEDDINEWLASIERGYVGSLTLKCKNCTRTLEMNGEAAKAMIEETLKQIDEDMEAGKSHSVSHFEMDRDMVHISQRLKDE